MVPLGFEWKCQGLSMVLKMVDAFAELEKLLFCVGMYFAL